MTQTYQEFYEEFTKEHIDPNELSANAFGLVVWDEQQKVIKKLKEIADKMAEEVHWGYNTINDNLQFGMPEDIAIGRRESRCKGIFITLRHKLNEIDKL